MTPASPFLPPLQGHKGQVNQLAPPAEFGPVTKGTDDGAPRRHHDGRGPLDRVVVARGESFEGSEGVEGCDMAADSHHSVMKDRVFGVLIFDLLRAAGCVCVCWCGGTERLLRLRQRRGGLGHRRDLSLSGEVNLFVLTFSPLAAEDRLSSLSLPPSPDRPYPYWAAA